MIVQTCTANEASGTRRRLPHGLHPVEAPPAQRVRVARSEVADLGGRTGRLEHDRPEVAVRATVPRREVVPRADDPNLHGPGRQLRATDRNEAPGGTELAWARAPNAVAPDPNRESAVEGPLNPHAVAPACGHTHGAHDLACGPPRDQGVRVPLDLTPIRRVRDTGGNQGRSRLALHVRQP